MRTIKCHGCGQIVTATGSEAFCPHCRAEITANAIWQARTCRACGAVFEGGPRAWYCPQCRAERAKASSRASKARARAGKTRQIGSIDICQNCGKEYTVNGPNQRYCPECAQNVVPQVCREQSRAWMAAHRESALERKKELVKNRRVCAVCGNVFYRDTPTVTCSPECAKILRSYRQAMADHKRRGSPAPTIDSVAERLARQSGIPGVIRSCNGKRWVARADNKHLGTFDTIEDAAQAVQDYNASKSNA